MTTSPGRPKGTRVIQCACGRRVAGMLGDDVTCPDCDRVVAINTKARIKKGPLFLKPPRMSRKTRRKT